MTKNRSGSSDEDDGAEAFAAAMRDVRKLGGPRRLPATQPSAPGASRPSPAAEHRRAASGPSPAADVARLSIDQVVESWTARADGVDKRVLRRLRDGAIAVEGTIDLHGLSVLAASRALDRFLESARAEGRRCLLIVHGRGLHSADEGARLRDLVRATLTSGPAASGILAASSAPAPLGGPGATLLWRRR